jgi:TonB family protein
VNKWFSLALLLLPYIAWAQTDTIYYNSMYQRCMADAAVKLEVINKMSDADYFSAWYQVSPFRLTRTVHYSSIEPPVYNGAVIRYYINGDTTHGIYSNNMYTGEERDYYDVNEDTLRCTFFFKDGLLHGPLISYYPNHKVKRRARYFKDKLVQGTQYDEQGSEVTYTPYMVMPEPMQNINRYLAAKLKYPRKAQANNIEGKVLVRFVVAKNGYIKDAVVISDTPEILNTEALRVVNNMKPWRPGMFDGEISETHFTLPISFQLN